MSPFEFERVMRALIHRQPFEPFQVELIAGERFTVDRADAVALNGDAAGFIAEDGSIHFFDSQTVRQLGQEGNGATP
jgi:hypothetical protein